MTLPMSFMPWAPDFAKSGAQGMKDMGKVMGLLKREGQGRVDMGKASALVKAQLGNL